MNVLISAVDIHVRVKQLARDITTDYYKQELIVIPVLNGAFVFASDLVRYVHNPKLTVSFIKVSSYQGQLSTGRVKFDLLPLAAIHNKPVLVVEDIVDTGRTCTELREALLVGMPASLKFCTLLDKPSRRLTPFHADYVGFEIPNKFVIGYGLDIDERYRQLPEIVTLDRNETVIGGNNGTTR